MTFVLIISLYLGVRLRGVTFNRSRAIKREVDKNVEIKGKGAEYYQKILQWFGAGKEILIFFAGSLQKDFFWLSLLLFLLHFFSGIIISELRFRRERSNYHGK